MSPSPDVTLPPPPSLDVDPFSDETIREPGRFHAALREAGPVVHIPKYDMYAVGRHETVTTVMRDFARFTSTGGIGLSDIRKPGAWRTPSPITEIDPPNHTQVRGALTQVLSPIVIRRWREHFQSVAEEQIEQLLADGTSEVEAVGGIVERYVLQVFPDVLGVRMPREEFLDIGEMNFNQIGPNNDLLRRSLEKAAPILANYDRYFARESMLPGGFGEKIFEAEDKGLFAPGTAGLQVRSFLRAGVDTTIAGIGHTLALLADHPASWDAIRADPAKARGAFEEAIRLQSPSTVMFRTTVGTPELGGYRLADDVKIGAFLGAANRDERRFAAPDRFDIGRDVTGAHVAFGTGAHVCIGQMIARLEAENILTALARRVVRIERAGPSEYKLINTLRTLDRLPLRLVTG